MFSGKVPFHGMQDTVAIANVIAKDERPFRPAHRQLSDQLWEMIQRCWRREPSERPTLQEVVAFLEK